jgi:hypothetical protein
MSPTKTSHVRLHSFAAGLLLLVHAGAQLALAQEPAFRLAPAVALEAEDFTVEQGWQVLHSGEGNYMVDAIGFCHTSGERFLAIDERDETAAAYTDVQAPVAGDYRLWVRYEYPAFCETRFRVVVEQAGRTLADHVMGTRDSPRYAFANPQPIAQHDPSWGPEGIMEEVVTVPGVAAGPARIWLRGHQQPQTPGIAAHRNIDLVYFTSDAADAWQPHYARQTNLYPVLDAFRDTRGPRYEARFTNRGQQPATFTVNHTYNRLPWYLNAGAIAADVAPGATTDWLPIQAQDTCHYHAVTFAGGGEPFDIELRPAGGQTERRDTGAASYTFYLPTYPGRGERIVTPNEEIDAVLAHLAATPPVGRAPTLPLCYGGWMPIGQDTATARKYAQLYAAIGMRSIPPAGGGPKLLENLQTAGIPPTRSWAIGGYRNPPTPEYIAAAQKQVADTGYGPYLQWYDYGDEIGFGEWMALLVQAETQRTGESAEAATARLWQAWLAEKRPGYDPAVYWLPDWGPLDAAKLRPNSSAEAAAANPRLYVDSLLFYEDASIAYVAAGAQAVRAALGDHVLCGANYSCHPFYYPSSTMYIKWFRRGAAEMGRHSEYFWQVAQAGPMINGYIAEHFRCGMRTNPRAVLRQYNMPHSPGNTEANFLRSAYTHLAHGATMLDFFGIGMNETFTENHIDHRDRDRYRAIRDVTHSIGLVEDILAEGRVVSSQVALLVSESTERWDFAGIALDGAGHAHFGPNFRQTRTIHHLERLGLWTALTFAGASPDLVVEEDLTAEGLAAYKLLVLVGDCLPPEAVPVLEAWVRGGGVLLATAGTGRFDRYKQPIADYEQLFGMTSRTTDDRVTFMRPRQELAFLEPIDGVSINLFPKLPALATRERIALAADATDLAYFDSDDTPGLVERRIGSGVMVYVAARPGLAYLWRALQPPLVPDRANNTHSIPEAFDEAARFVVESSMDAAGVARQVRAEPGLIDARVIAGPQGWAVPVANYHNTVGQNVTLTIKLEGTPTRVTSAYHGELPFAVEESGGLIVTIPALGYGDMLRIDR